MLFNATHKLSKYIAPPSQDDIYNCPHYFGMSLEQVKRTCPQFLKDLLDQFPWDGRKTHLQIRPQDFRHGNPPQRGAFWHLDDNAEMIRPNGSTYDKYAKDINDWHLMSITWGAGSKTEFCDLPLDLPYTTCANEGNVIKALPATYPIMAAEHDYLYEYTSRDLHRGDGKCHKQGLRLFIVAFDSSDFENNERILPSIRQLDGK